MVVTAEPDGMGTLWAMLTATDAAGAFTWLTRLARGLGADDPRSMDARRADLLAALLNGRLLCSTDTDTATATDTDTATATATHRTAPPTPTLLPVTAMPSAARPAVDHLTSLAAAPTAPTAPTVLIRRTGRAGRSSR